MIHTNHDLCANRARLNFEELWRAVQIGVARSLWDCEQGLHDAQCSTTSRARMLAAEKLASAAEDLHKTATSFYYMEEARTREELKIDRQSSPEIPTP